MADNDNVPGGPDRDAADREPQSTEAPAASSPDPGHTAAQPAVAAEAAPGPVLKTRWRDRAWSFRAMLAVALATLVIGGLAGGAIVAVADGGGDGHHRMGRWGPGGPMMGGPGWRGPRRFDDGGPRWRWNDGPQAPELTPYGGATPTPPTPSPSG